MSKFIICGGERLSGKVDVQGAKNAVLPLYAASILTDEEVVLHNVPNLADVENMGKILVKLGAKIKREGSSVTICAKDVSSHEIPNELAKNLRSSVFLLGSILGRIRKAKVAYPGGCDIGLRPIDLHLKALKDMGVTVVEQSGYILCNADTLNGNEVVLDYPSVGATENVILAAVFAKGKTTLHNAAREPEITELQLFLNKMGAKVFGAGTSRIRIEGVKKLHGLSYTVMPDRIAAGTYLLAGVMTGGEIELHNARLNELRALLGNIDKSSCIINDENGNIYVKSKGRHRVAASVSTRPYPGFPTDLQAPFCSFASIAEGTCVMTETIFENRFRHIPELMKMGADIFIRDRVAVIKGVPYLNGTEVFAKDLRGGAALVLAGLVAEGVTLIDDVHHIDRGYEAIEEKLSELGAKITRI